jgi:Ca2+-binding RTX toxin-like protein
VPKKVESKDNRSTEIDPLEEALEDANLSVTQEDLLTSWTDDFGKPLTEEAWRDSLDDSEEVTPFEDQSGNFITEEDLIELIYGSKKPTTTNPTPNNEQPLLPSFASESSTSTSTSADNLKIIAINKPKLEAMGKGNLTGLPNNQALEERYFLTDEDDTTIPAEASGKNVYALSGNDSLTGSVSKDVIFANQGADQIDGGGGDNEIYGGKGSDNISATTGNNLLSGNNDNDNLTGGDGKDVLYGGQGNDVLTGNGGDDILTGDKGYDVLYGGAGNDVFALSVSDHNPTDVKSADQILDWQVGDWIDLPEGVTVDQLQFESVNIQLLEFQSVNIKLDNASPVMSTALKLGENYLGVVYGVDRTALTSNSFL